MSNVSTAKSKHFIDYWVYLPSAIAACLLLLSMFGGSFAQTLVDKIVSIEEGESVKIETIALQPSKLGALRINVKSFLTSKDKLIGTDDWIVYEILLVDKQGNIIASAIDEDWYESGIWREGGESGTWRESDSIGGIDLRSRQNEPIDVVIRFLERKETTGITPYYQPVSFKVIIQNNVIDRRPLGWGFFFSSIVAITALYATKASGSRAIAKRIADSVPQARAIVGGKNNLVRVKVATKLDETTPRRLTINLAIDNAYGERVYNRDRLVSVAINKNDSRVSGSARLTYFLVLEPQDSYSFKVNITSDEAVDSTYLEVRQDCKTLTAVDVTTIISS